LIESTPADKPRDIRDRAVLEVLYSTWIRRAELIALTIYDVDFGRNSQVFSFTAISSPTSRKNS
jgi:site-specific recombinase XerD